MKNKLHHLIGLKKIHRMVPKNYHNRFLGVIYDKRTLKNKAFIHLAFRNMLFPNMIIG